MIENRVKILIVDDEVNSSKLMKKIIDHKGYSCVEENNSVAAKDLIESGEFDIVVSDLQMPTLSGLDLLKIKPHNTIFIMVTGYGSVDSAVEAMKHGAFDYINKPFNLEEFSVKIDKAVSTVEMNKEIQSLRSLVSDTQSFGAIVGKSKKMHNVFDTISKVAKTNANILVEGQSGTGKELVSRSIHLNSDRSRGPFVAINCSAIPENLLESELFGHTKGAFTGATEAQRGVFEQANGGTLLLDEIAEMPYVLQSKLLRVLETWEIKALGSDKTKKVDVRLISATNQNLKDLIQKKKFREDLYFRISTVTISLPPLNERKDDIPLLTDHFLKHFSETMGKKLAIDSSAMEILVKNDWKGNVRELENTIERAVITSGLERLDKSAFSFLIKDSSSNDNPFDALKDVKLKEVEKIYIKQVLDQNEWNKLKAAKILGIDRKTLYKKIKEFDLE
jgi:DNA-binding NtrC family response regulator